MTLEHPPAEANRGEVLIAIMNNQRDFALLQDQLWYRIPVESAPRRWPPHWLAFYQTRVFGTEAYAARYYGRVAEIEIVSRRELFPNEFPSPQSERLYHRVRLDSLAQLPQPIISRRWRRIVFIPTTWRKFTQAAEINELYDESPLEDRLWTELKRLQIGAERQWGLKLASRRYQLDFAAFCRDGQIDIETDGDTWHSERAQIASDNERDNALQANGWHVLRFNGRQIQEAVAEYCIPTITATINRLGGLSEDGLIARSFYTSPHGMAQQLALLEAGEDYEINP